MGSYDTAPEVLGIIAYYFMPLPLLLLARRYRKVAALCFALAAGLYIAGAVQNEMYLQAQSAQGMVPFDYHVDRVALTKSLARETAPFFATAAFLLITDLLKWPRLFAENPAQKS